MAITINHQTNDLSATSGTITIDGSSVGGGPTLEATASGSLSNGNTVVINSDGTVSIVSSSLSAGTEVVISATGRTNDPRCIAFDSNANKMVLTYVEGSNPNRTTLAVVGTVSGTSISFGTPVVFSTGGGGDTATVVFDSNANKIVITYRPESDSFRGYIVIGTVSGTSISFGTPVVFYSSTTTNQAMSVFDSTSNKIVTTYSTSGNDYGYAIVGTVSGTSISFGSPVNYNATYTYAPRPVFDSNANKIVIAFMSGTDNWAIVGTVSGTSISFGTRVGYIGDDTQNHEAVFDSSSNKVVVLFYDQLATVYGSGTARVGTVSGTSISFGSKVVFRAASTSEIQGTFDSVSNKVVAAYRGSTYGQIQLGTVSGTSISFDSAVDFTNTGYTNQINVAFDSTSNKIVTYFKANQNSSLPSASVVSSVSSSVRYIGIANGAYADGATATVQLVGSVDDAQSGLTAGSKYYVQGGGTLATTPDDPEVYAGVAVSASKIIIKG